MSDIKALCDSLQDLNRDVCILQGAIKFVCIGKGYLGEQYQGIVSDVMWVLEREAKRVSDSTNDVELLALRIKKGDGVRTQNAGHQIMQMMIDAGIWESGNITEEHISIFIKELYRYILLNPDVQKTLNVTNKQLFNLLGGWLVEHYGSPEAAHAAIPGLVDDIAVKHNQNVAAVKESKRKQQRRRKRYKRR